MKSFEDTVAQLHQNSSANQFEKALADFAIMIGLASERRDENGEGPDVLWLLPGNIGFVIEAKSRKKAGNVLRKGEHGQLLVASEWFAANYKGHSCIRVSIHPTNLATKAAEARASYALTYAKLSALISDARALLTALCESQLSDDELISHCSRLLAESSVRADCLVNNYLVPFEETD